MYAQFPGDSDLEQGDICIGLSIPCVSEDAQSLDAQGKQRLWEPQALKVPAFFVRSVSTPLVILSQSCDLVAEGAVRVLVAPTVPDTDPRFTAQYQKAAEDVMQSQAKSFVTKGNVDLEKAHEKLENARGKVLERLRLGDIPNAFPLRAIEGDGWQLDSSVCFFDNAISLPANWIPALKQTRRLRLNTAWKSVLQESLGLWLGRFAYPGTQKERLAVFADTIVPTSADTQTGK